MNIHISKSSKAAGLLRIIGVMLLLCLLLSACGKKEENNTGNDAAEPAAPDTASAGQQEAEPEAAPSAWDIAFSTGKAGLEEISLWPDDFTGFTIGFMPGNRDALFADATPVRTDEYGVEYYEIPEILAGQLTGETAQLCTIVSLGPDGSVLWKAPSFSGNGYALYIQRDRTLVAAAQSSNRGAADSNGLLAETLEQKINRDPYVSNGSVEYSADGRYLFINDTNDRWGVSGRLDLPYLLDTRTGEFFLMFNDPEIDQVIPLNRETDSGHRAFGMQDGHFTKDGRYLVAVTVGYNMPDWESGRRLMRYDLETGNAEFFALDNVGYRVMEVSDNRFLTYTSDSGWQILTVTDSQVVQEAFDWHGIKSSELDIYHNLSGPAVALMHHQTANFSALSILRNLPESEDDWLVLQNPNDETFETMTSAELSSLMDEEITKNRAYGAFVPGGGVKCWLAPVVPVSGTPYILAGVHGPVPYAESWKVFSEQGDRSILLNTETLEIRPIQFDFERLDIGRFFVWDDIVMIGGNVFRLKQDAAEAPEPTEAKTGETISGRNREIPEAGRKIETSEFAYRVTAVETGKLACINSGFHSLGFWVTNDFSILDDGYRLTMTLDMAPDPDNRDSDARKYIVPRALTEERMEEVKEQVKALSKADSKKLQAAYRKVEPKKLEKMADRDQLLAYYPSLREQTLYILKDTYTQTSDQEKLDSILQKAGYTMEDYEADQQLTDLRAISADVDFALTYTFSTDDPSLQWTAGTAGALCTLADHLASTVYRQYLTAEPRPEFIESLPIIGGFTYEGISFNVDLEFKREAEDGSVSLVFTVSPEDEWGRFLR